MLNLRRFVGEKIKLERAGAELWLHVLQLDTDEQTGKPRVVLGFESDPTNFVISRAELLRDEEADIIADAESLLT